MYIVMHISSNSNKHVRCNPYLCPCRNLTPFSWHGSYHAVLLLPQASMRFRHLRWANRASGNQMHLVGWVWEFHWSVLPETALLTLAPSTGQLVGARWPRIELSRTFGWSWQPSLPSNCLIGVLCVSGCSPNPLPRCREQPPQTYPCNCKLCKLSFWADCISAKTCEFSCQLGSSARRMQEWTISFRAERLSVKASLPLSLQHPKPWVGQVIAFARVRVDTDFFERLWGPIFNWKQSN